jgi:hypothetical protein
MVLSKSVPIPLSESAEFQVGYSFTLIAESMANALGYAPVGAELYSYNSISTDVDKTMKLSGVLIQLSDGTLVTPESIGAILTFDSGIRSPNVPEPSSGFLLGLGGVYAVTAAFRRRRAVHGEAWLLRVE